MECIKSKTGIIHVCRVEEMGILVSHHRILLDGDFIKEKLLTRQFVCPFCKENLLKLIKVELIHSGDSPESSYPIGNKYEYDCSGEECLGQFFGEVYHGYYP
ncbi:MAG: hypothetical protein Athens101410_669 [Parcubacteria group bacterium Athens1014_10]|nr:MAG: hypothetical protein Athens101410_669 [Parcubacteria group bacterium Athens1014_10]TSD05178.1 MAG: hypothetical protein Athens071412_376 [Parcubacteria group bacterium Athens0714_12]